MAFKAVTFDLDGTLLTSQNTILESSKQAIRRIREKEVKVFIVTGRHHTAVRPYYIELGLDTPVICCNGTYLYDFQRDEVLESNPLSTEEVQFVLEQAQSLGIQTSVYTRDAMTFEVLNPHFEKLLKWVNTFPADIRPNVYQVPNFQQVLADKTIIWKVLVSDPDTQKLKDLVEKLPLQYSAEWSWIDRVDITRQGNSKGGGLANLLAMEQINPEKVIAFGDNFNDISMLKLVGQGIAMGNADLEVQQSAKQTIGSNNEDSIAHALAQWIQ